jgi:hypothetical protein
MMEAIRASETSVNFNWTTGLYIPEDSKLYVTVKLHVLDIIYFNKTYGVESARLYL